MEPETQRPQSRRTMLFRRALPLLACLLPLLLLLAGLMRGWELCTVLSGSMEPALPVGSLLVVAPDRQLRAGEIVTFVQGKNRVTHRVAAVNPDGSLVTWGDANAEPDNSPVRPDQVEGRVVLCLPGLGWPALWLQNSPLRALLPVLAGALFMLALWPQKRKEEANETPNMSATGRGTGAERDDHGGGALRCLVQGEQQPGGKPFCPPGAGD